MRRIIPYLLASIVLALPQAARAITLTPDIAFLNVMEEGAGIGQNTNFTLSTGQEEYLLYIYGWKATLGWFSGDKEDSVLDPIVFVPNNGGCTTGFMSPLTSCRLGINWITSPAIREDGDHGKWVLGLEVEYQFGISHVITGVQAITVFDPPAVPLPAALPLFATGLGVMGWLARHRKRKAAALAA